MLPLTNFCRDNGVNFDVKNSKDVITSIIRSLSTNPDQHYLFVCDEVYASSSDGQTSADWSDLATAENVTWVLAVRPASTGDDIQNLTPPSGPSIISRKLLHSHRNSYQIRSVSIGVFCDSHQYKILQRIQNLLDVSL